MAAGAAVLGVPVYLAQRRNLGADSTLTERNPS
jgi:hypothetical protein